MLRNNYLTDIELLAKEKYNFYIYIIRTISNMIVIHYTLYLFCLIINLFSSLFPDKHDKMSRNGITSTNFRKSIRSYIKRVKHI